jgi:HEAT repeat protein
VDVVALTLLREQAGLCLYSPHSPLWHFVGIVCATKVGCVKKCLIVSAIALGIGAGLLTLPHSDEDSSEKRQIVLGYLGALTSPDYQRREEARVALAQVGPEATPFLIATLADRPNAFETIFLRINGRLSLFPIVPSSSLPLRMRAAEQLATLALDDSRTIAVLADALDEEDGPLVEEAQRSLRRIGPATVVPQLITVLREGNLNARRHAAEVLRDFGPAAASATPALLHLLKDRNVSARVEAARAVARVGGVAARRGLTVAIDDRSAAVRAAAADALGWIGDEAGPAATKVREHLADRHPRVRVCSARALWSITRDASATVPVLSAALREPVCWEAALALGAMGPSASNAVPALIDMLKREKVPRPLRETPVSALALGQIGVPSVPGLIETLTSPDPRVRTSAALALGFVGGKALEATKGLVSLLSDPDPDVRRAATLGLGAIDPARKELVPALVRMASDDDIFLSSLASSTLERIDPAAAASVRRE